MESIINNIIPQQNFEKVGERIGAILTVELTNQKDQQAFADPVNVFSERLDPPNDTEEIIINVQFHGTNDNDHSQKRTQGNVVYYVDVYATGRSKTDVTGSLDSNRRCNKFLGMIRYILAYTGYKTLGYQPGIIGGVYVDGIQKMFPETIDARYTTMGRITVSVRMTEDQDLENGPLISETLTGVKLDLTDKGYQYKTT